MNLARLLIVEDDSVLADALVRAFQQDGHTVDWFEDGRLALEALVVNPPDTVILDLTLQGMDGLQLLRAARAEGCESPVLLLTARGEPTDRVAGLDTGADDYLVKPFELAELEARIRALLRRRGPTRSTTIKVGEVEFDAVSRRVKVAGRSVELPRRELALLEVFISHPGRVFDKETLLDRVFGYDDDVNPGAVELYVCRLRKRLQPSHVKIRTLRGLGYLLEV
ncbi:MAG TPA: response regulator transcription factor [Geminicoccaceae bacterium]|nr:response regulator transcription factor [Geminicoccaceae bacterium]